MVRAATNGSALGRRLVERKAKPKDQPATGSRCRFCDAPFRPLRILINFQNNPHAIARNTGDPRLQALLGLARALSSNGHTVLATCGWGGLCGRPCGTERDYHTHGFGFYQDPREHLWGRELLNYSTYTVDYVDPLDIIITWAHTDTCDDIIRQAVAMQGETSYGRTFRFVYEHGLASGLVASGPRGETHSPMLPPPPCLLPLTSIPYLQVTIDPKGLLDHSYYAVRLNKVVQAKEPAKGAARGAAGPAEGPSVAQAPAECVMPSKRPQRRVVDVPSDVWGRYIFVPTQKALDVSVMRHSNTSMEAVISGVLRFATPRDIPVVFKVHPHLFHRNHTGGEGGKQEALIQSLAGKAGRAGHVFTSHADVRWLMAHALFTVTINGGTLYDNFVTQVRRRAHASSACERVSPDLPCISPNFLLTVIHAARSRRRPRCWRWVGRCSRRTTG